MDKKNYAKVHSIETFGTVDGPGVRFVIFLQGCHLQCKYCHNRDTWDINSGKYMSVEELVTQIEKYKTYITPNGGVTVTGGEPLLQPYFLVSLFKELSRDFATSSIVSLDILTYPSASRPTASGLYTFTFSKVCLI